MTTMTEQSNVAAPTFVASVLRFSEDPPAMRAFLEALGLSVEISKGDGWFTLKGRSGEVSLHASGDRSATDAPGGRTGLVLVTPDARVAAEGLEAQGLKTRSWDESFGVQAMVQTPLGPEISINEEQNDLYGYEQHDPRPGPIDVVVVYFTDDLDVAARFFARFGFQPDADGSEDCHALRNGDRGVINLHRSSGDQPEGAVGLSFESDEPLPDIADRLRAAGYEPSLEDDPQRLAATDPDGRLIEIWPAPAT
ncbi:VOC family protein [Microlunatus speluncae]|uniref:VOC family protein n=1 Tax=Microlunatus speluncae TaxID=2594267 RepID=UPI0012664D5D|nr:VOC family protein [Microlunatus speluncae]